MTDIPRQAESTDIRSASVSEINMTPQDFRELLRTVEAEQIVEDIILSGAAQHVPVDDIEFIHRAIAEKF
jgi:hypothetical protein